MPDIIIRRKNGSINIPNLSDQAIGYKHVPLIFLNIAALKRLGPSAETTGRSSIRQVFLDVNMVNHHQGLLEIARKKKVDVTELKPGDFLLFINARGSYCKIMGANISPAGRPPMFPVTSIKSPRGQISPLILRELPKFFFGQPFDYDATLKPLLEAHLNKQTRERATRRRAEGLAVVRAARG